MGKAMGRRRVFYFAWAATLVFGAGSASAQSPDPDTAIEAVWKPQRMSFAYHGYSTLYTCQSLQAKLETILTNVGARDGIQLRTYSCDDERSIARFEIALESPVEATPENIRALTTYDATDELLARMHGQRLATAEDVQRFPAVWKTVSFTRSREMKLVPGDCELVLQLRRHILPRLAVQIVRDGVRCSQFGNIGRPQLTVSALVPVGKIPE
jgi:hypothetical protein